MKVKIKYLSEQVKKPGYATGGSAGMDLSAATDAEICIAPGERFLIPTGIAVSIPEGFGGFVFPRSGLASKSGISMANCVGVIDSDYTGEIKVALYNISDSAYTVHPGDRIAQLVFLPVEQAELEEAEELTWTERGSGGFGSTGR